MTVTIIPFNKINQFMVTAIEIPQEASDLIYEVLEEFDFDSELVDAVYPEVLAFLMAPIGS